MPAFKDYPTKDYSTRRDRQIRSFRRTLKRILTFSTLIVMILGVSYVITYVIEAPQRKAIAQSASAAEAAKREEDQKLLAEQYGPVYGPNAEQLSGAVSPITAKQLALSENGRVEMKYFETALFIGDSLTQGLNEYASGIKEAKYAAYRGAGPKTLLDGVTENADGAKVSYFDIFKSAAAQKIYIMLGANSLNTNTTDEAFIKYYGDLLDKLKAELTPGTKIYVQSILPVSAEKSADERFSVQRISSLNEQLAKMAIEKDMYYLDVASAVSNESGNMKEEYLAPLDGIHMNNQGYAAWKEYLITHTKHSPDNPYVMGSPFYKQGE